MITKFKTFENIEIDNDLSHSEIIIKNLQIQSQLNMFHWQAEKYGDHNKFDEFNDLFKDLSDKLIEVIQGHFGRVNIPDDVSIPLRNTDELEPINFFDNCVEFYNNSKKVYKDEDDIISIMDDIVGEFQKLKYLLTFK